LEYIINMKEFGAVPDNSTDCSRIIQTAADSLTSGGILYFPTGTYRMHKPVFFSNDHISIIGDSWHSRIIFDYVQTDTDTTATASAFSFTEGVRDIRIRDLGMEFEGCFYPEFGDSYRGKSCGLKFNKCHDVLVEHCEISGFNASGIEVATGDPGKYAERFKVDKCYLHHNRVAGVAFGYVDGISITNCDLEYMGSILDGGTGYGCTGSSGEHPKNIQLIGNRARFNYRKGLDLHAGTQAIIEGNICDGNRLYGIYTEGSKTGDVIIRGNLIKGMERVNTGIPEPYTWIHGISIGPWARSAVEKDYFNFIISENEIREFGLEDQDAYPINVYGSLASGTFLIKNNYLQCGKINSAIHVSCPGSGLSGLPSYDISGNFIRAREISNNLFQFANFKTASIHANQVVVGTHAPKSALELKRACGVLMLSSNLWEVPGCTGLTDEFNGKKITFENYINGEQIK